MRTTTPLWFRGSFRAFLHPLDKQVSGFWSVKIVRPRALTHRYSRLKLHHGHFLLTPTWKSLCSLWRHYAGRVRYLIYHAFPFPSPTLSLVSLPLTLSSQHDHGSYFLRLYRAAHNVARPVLVLRRASRLHRRPYLDFHERNWMHSARRGSLSRAALIFHPKQAGNYIRHQECSPIQKLERSCELYFYLSSEWVMLTVSFRVVGQGRLFSNSNWLDASHGDSRHVPADCLRLDRIHPNSIGGLSAGAGRGRWIRIHCRAKCFMSATGSRLPQEAKSLTLINSYICWLGCCSNKLSLQRPCS
jgi:hypothetical protein